VLAARSSARLDPFRTHAVGGNAVLFARPPFVDSHAHRIERCARTTS
jgi:hypothetical protein